jgi:hypothetical protein
MMASRSISITPGNGESVEKQRLIYFAPIAGKRVMGK